ncbi:MAG: hypothetical protein PHS49_07625 [Candidatus Gracilibacteria bacterium]|nr:hypothetical protein [Candidatus Gracilibacteria bacterium]
MIYIYYYSYINIEKPTYNFLEAYNSGDINNKEEHGLIYKIEDYENCFKKGCEVLEYYRNDITSINKYLENNFSFVSLIKENKEIKEMIKKKEYLENKGISTTNFKINFDIDSYTKNYLNTIKIQRKEYLTLNNNIFINKKQYFKYLDNYLYKIYDYVKYNDIEGIRTLENDYERNVFKLPLNRKYLYNVLIIAPKNIYSDMSSINSLTNNINKINH